MKKRFAASALLVLLSAGICARIATAQIRFTPIQLYVQFRSAPPVCPGEGIIARQELDSGG